MAAAAVDEDLVRQAATAARLAPTACLPTGCGWYHGVWPALRAHGVVASPHRNGEFFSAALVAAAHDGLIRVLVTGTADAGMLDIVLDAYGESGVTPAITVLDRCPTPIEVAVEEAAARGVVVEGWVEDINVADRPGAFDLLVTHGLLTMMGRHERPAIAEAWARLVRPGGRLVTTVSIAGPDAPDRSTFSPDAVDAFAERCRALGGEILAGPAREWAERVSVEPVRSVDEVRGPLADAGFDVTVELRRLESALDPSASGPWTARAATYAEIVARRMS